MAETSKPWVDWSPWAVKGDRRVVASEAAWRRAAREDEWGQWGGARMLVRVVPDLFEDWRGPLVDANGELLLVDRMDAWRRNNENISDRAWPTLMLADVRRRVFDLIDQTPNVDWLVSTEWPDRIAGVLPNRQSFKFPGSVEQEPIPNLWLGARISTQAEADERIPHLLRLPAARRWLDVAPTEGINLRRLMYRGEFMNVLDTQNDMSAPHFDWVRIAGDAHLDAAKSLVDQCRAAGVPCWCEGDEGAREIPNG